MFGDAHDAVGVVHSVFFNAIDRWVHLSAGAVEVCGVDVDDQWFSADVLCVDSGGVGEPVVSVDDVKLLLACDDACHDGVVVAFILQVLGIASGEADASQIVGEPIVEVGVDVISEIIVKLGVHLGSEALSQIIGIHVAPNDGCFAQADDVHETFVLIAPGLWKTESDVHIRLSCQTFGDAIAGCAKSA